MTPERFRQIDQLVDLALEQSSAERTAFLDKACSGDDELRREVESLLAADERTRSFLAETPAQIAADLVRRDCKEAVDEGSPTVSPPSALGRYVVREEIGRGGMGVVYAAYDPELDRKLAIKLMRPETSATISASEGRARLMREAQALARLSHPNVIAVHDVGTFGDQVFIAMEYVEGGTLRQWLTERNRPWREVLSMFVQAGRGLAAAHAGGILHRDFKPENALIDKEGRARVVDFGLARAIEPAESETRNAADAQAPDAKTTPRLATPDITVTHRGRFGTPAYMAPEQLMGERVDEKTDQYSFCVALFEALYDRLPFSADTVATLLDQIEGQRVGQPSKSVGVPTRVRKIVLRGLSRLREDRYESMDVLLDELAHRAPRVWRWSIGAVLLLASIVALGWFRRQRPNQEPPRTIAVLPMENLSHDPQQEYLADGLTDELITNLSKVGSLRVIARSSVTRYKSQPRSIPEIARDLKVDGVLEGTVLPSGDRVRIAAQFIDASTGQSIWAESYEGVLGDVLALQTRMARAMLAGIRVKLSAQDDQRLAIVQPVDSDAYLAYLRGIFYWDQGFAKDSINTAIGMFEQAIALDPKFALAYARLAIAYAFAHMDMEPNTERAEKALVYAQRSLALDPNLAEAYVARGFVNAMRELPMETVVQDFHQAAMLSPNLPEAHWRLGTVYLHAGLLDEALLELNKVLALDPHHYRARHYIARAHRYQQKYDQALLDYERSPDLQPGNLWEEVLVLFNAGQKTTANELLSELRRKLPDNADMASTHAVLLAAEGKNVQAEEQIRLALRIGGAPGHFVHAEYNIGSAYALMGNHQEALRWLRTAANHRFPCYPLFERDPNLNNLRGDPDFKTWLGEMKSLWEHHRATLH